MGISLEFTDYVYVILCEDSVEAAEKLITYMVAELV